MKWVYFTTLIHITHSSFVLLDIYDILIEYVYLDKSKPDLCTLVHKKAYFLLFFSAQCYLTQKDQEQLM